MTIPKCNARFRAATPISNFAMPILNRKAYVSCVNIDYPICHLVISG